MCTSSMILNTENVYSSCGTSAQVGSDIGEIFDRLNGLGAREVAHKWPVASLTLSNSTTNIVCKTVKTC